VIKGPSLHDLAHEGGAGGGDALLRAERDRQRAAADRTKAADDRARATADRRHAAQERAAARERMDAIAATVMEADERYTISFGLAELEPGDGLEELVGRADANLLEARHSQRGE
jgi:GGDEF domain-containing protein